MPLPFTDEKKEILFRQIFSLYSKYGFDGISMDEVAAKVHVSKATLYKYFKSKEDIVRQIEKVIAEHTDISFLPAESIDNVLSNLSQLYTKGVLIAANSSDHFLRDLKEKFPDLYASHTQIFLDYVESFKQFYADAVHSGYCKDLAFYMLGEQMRKMLPTVISQEYLTHNGITLKESITEYYKIFLYQLLSEKYLYVIDIEETYAFVDRLSEVIGSTFLI